MAEHSTINFTRRDSPWAIVLTMVWSAISAYCVMHHAMWRDETRAWQIALASPTINALHQNLRYEGTPILWYLLLWMLTHFTTKLLAMQIFHLLIAGCTVVVFLCAAPFNRWIKGLFAFGYFPFFEYSIICRSYGLLFLLALLATALLCLKRLHTGWLGFVLFLMTQVSIWGAGFAALFVLTMSVSWNTDFGNGRKWISPRYLLLSLAVLAGICLCYWQAKPGPGDFFLIRWRDQPIGVRAAGTIGTLWAGWVPFPQLQLHFWNTNSLDHSPYIQAIAGLSLLCLAVAILRDRPAAMMFLLLGVAGLLGFTFFAFVGFTRHHGHLFILLLCSLWIAQSQYSDNTASDNRRLHRKRELGLIVLLAVHVVAGVSASVLALQNPFSAGKAAADFIRQYSTGREILVGVDDYCMSPVATYLGRPFYFPQVCKVLPFNSQDDLGRLNITQEILLQQLAGLIAERHESVMLVLSGGQSLQADEFDASVPMPNGQTAMSLRVMLLNRFEESIVEDETFAIYRIDTVPHAGTSASAANRPPPMLSSRLHL